MTRVLALTGLLVVAACDDVPSCGAVADHVQQLQAKGGSSLKVSDRNELVKNCEAESPGNERMRSCMMKATSLEEAKGCELEAALGR